MSCFPNLLPKILAAWLCLLAVLPEQSRGQSKEYQVKAAFLFNFAQFVEWPADAYSSTNEPFCIGILGENPFGSVLDEMVQGEHIGVHSLSIVHTQKLDGLGHCQMVFICKSEKKHLPEILSALKARPVLTVSELDGFARDGGGINFYLEDNKVRFEINAGAAKDDGLKISSQLLTLGRLVSTAREERR